MAQVLAVPQKSNDLTAVPLLAPFTISRKSRCNYELIRMPTSEQETKQNRCKHRVAAAKRLHLFASCLTAAESGFSVITPW